MMFDYDWRLAHAEAGDRAVGEALEIVEGSPSDVARAQAYAAIAQAHYAAANVRARPVATTAWIVGPGDEEAS